MKHTKKLTLVALLSALATGVMLVSYFPYLTYAVPALAGAVLVVAAIELSPKWALLGYVVSAFLAFLFAENEAKMLYICFFGCYPILKGFLERISSRVLEYGLKFVLLNGVLVALYFGLTRLLGLPMEDTGFLDRYGVPVLLLLANGVFLAYDLALTRLIGFYMWRLHPRVKKIIE